MVSQTVILNQWQEWECAFFSILWALMRIKQIDHTKIIEEARPDFNKMMTIKMAWKWFIKHWYIKDIVPYRYNPLLLPQIPLIARIYRVDWKNTNKTPFKLVIGEKNANAHYVCITDKWTCVNSWWENWWDKGYFYFDPVQISAFSFIHRIIL
jgi:hypothetical protein